MGTSDELSLDILINTLIGFSRDLAGLQRVVVGGVNSDWPVPSLPEDDDSEGQVSPSKRGSFILPCCSCRLYHTFVALQD